LAADDPGRPGSSNELSRRRDEAVLADRLEKIQAMLDRLQQLSLVPPRYAGWRDNSSMACRGLLESARSVPAAGPSADAQAMAQRQALLRDAQSLLERLEGERAVIVRNLSNELNVAIQSAAELEDEARAARYRRRPELPVLALPLVWALVGGVVGFCLGWWDFHDVRGSGLRIYLTVAMVFAVVGLAIGIWKATVRASRNLVAAGRAAPRPGPERGETVRRMETWLAEAATLERFAEAMLPVGGLAILETFGRARRSVSAAKARLGAWV
jgi:hypothetical protein